MKNPSIMDDAVMNQRTERVLFVGLLLTGLFGVLIGLPWTLAVLRDNPSTGWWWEAAGDLLFFIPASAAVGVWLGKKVGLGSGLRELVSGTSGCWKHVRLSLVPGTLVGLTLGAIQLISQNMIPKDALAPELNNPNTFEWLLRCLSAALTEEIAFRFGLMSFFSWIIWAIVKRDGSPQSCGLDWSIREIKNSSLERLDRFLRRKRFHEKIELSAARLIGHFDLLNSNEIEFFRHRLLDFQIQFDRFLHPS